MDQEKPKIFSDACARKLAQLHMEVRSATARGAVINQQVVMLKLLTILIDEQPVDLEVTATAEEAAKVARA